jgi:diguanylate cyclase (GGDEF)-like protein/putative nucleotidyltransferase with HDIG domain
MVDPVGDGHLANARGSLFVSANLQTGLVARILSAVFAAGATLTAVTIPLPRSAHVNEVGLVSVVAASYLTAILLRWRAEKLPVWALHVALCWGSTLITVAAYFSGGRPSPLVFFYLWVFLYASYLFTRIQAIAQIAYVAVAFGVLLALRPPLSGAASWWLVGLGTLLAVAIVIMAMRTRVERLITQLYEAARTDPLTKLSNRRGFRELLDLELERCRRGGVPMSVVVGDLDRFKEVNDRSGHQVGDAALQRVAGLLCEGKRQIDVAARVGGEEFALILPDTLHEGAFTLCERLRRALGEEFAHDTVSITISFGVAVYPDHGETAASLLRSADEALYAAKEAGRNQTVVYGPALRDKRRAAVEARGEMGGERLLAVVLDLAETVDLRFSGSARHSETVGRYAEMMARELGLPEPRVARVRLAGILHDIGKIGVPDRILHKEGKLTAAEFAMIRRHPELGAQILEHPSLVDVREWVLAHHERPDGLGYPRGLFGDQVALEARIIAVADVYEAMTSDRSYRDSIGQEAALAELRRCAGTQFDARVVEAFIAALGRESAHEDAVAPVGSA